VTTETMTAATPTQTAPEPLSIREALKLLRTNTQAELEAANAAHDRARQRFELVTQIERLLGFDVKKTDTYAEAHQEITQARTAVVQALAEVKNGGAGHVNGNGHANGTAEKTSAAPESRETAKAAKARAEVEKIVGGLSPQLSKLYKLLDSRRGSFTTKEQIMSKLDLSNSNQASPMITKLREEGISIEAAKTLRAEGEPIPDGVTGWRLE
jgi:hypothetical protein